MTELRGIRGSSPKMREAFYSLFPKKNVRGNKFSAICDD